jgi:hypothetical protein
MLVGLSAPTAWAVVQRQGDQLQARFATQKTMAREADRLRERAAQIADPEALLKDRRTLQLVLESYGLESEINKTAILRKLMTQDPDADGALAGQMTDQRYRQFARDFSNWSPTPPLQRTGAIDTILERWQTARFEKQLGEDAPGLREALYFQRNAPGAETVLQLMSDPALSLVLRVGLGLPAQFASLEFDQQRATLEKRVDMETFSDPKRLDQFLRRFLVRYEQEFGGAANSNPLASLLSNDGGTGGLFNLLGSTLNLRV